MDSIKIQLNSESAIRALIAEDPDLELEIKNKIACSIAEGYEKINAGIIELSISKLSGEISTLIWNSVAEKRRSGYDWNTYLKSDIQNLVKERVKAEINHFIWEAVEEARLGLKALITERVDSIASDIVQKTTTEIFENTVRREVIRRYDEIQKTLDAEETKS